MIQHLQRMSTEYIVGEDRIRLSGEVENAASVVIWLTRRLLERLLPAVLNWLEGQGVDTPYSEIMHSFAQQASTPLIRKSCTALPSKLPGPNLHRKPRSLLWLPVRYGWPSRSNWDTRNRHSA